MASRRPSMVAITGVVCVLRSAGGPPGVATQSSSPRLLVEAEQPVPRRAQLAPAAGDEGDDQPIAVDRRRLRAAAVAGEEAELLHQVAAPHHLAGAVEAEEGAAHALGVEVAGLGVAGEVGPTDAVLGDGRVVDVEALLPEQLAVAGVVAGHAFLAPGAFSRAAVDAGATVEDDGGRAGGQRGAPDDVLPALRPAGDQTRLGRVGILVGTAPGRPLAAAEGRRKRSHRGEQRGARHQGCPRAAKPAAQTPPRTATRRPHCAGCSPHPRLQRLMPPLPPLYGRPTAKFWRHHPSMVPIHGGRR